MKGCREKEAVVAAEKEQDKEGQSQGRRGFPRKCKPVGSRAADGCRED